MGDTVLGKYAGAFVDELHRAGMRHVCAAPGSRSTPLAMMFHQHPGVRLWMHLDERSCAFFALGMARALQEPVAVLCTSGTAAAELYPAVIEARYGRVPLVVLTTDRPPELRDVGAPQTIDQLHLYAGNVKWFAEMALPEATPSAIRYVRAAADRAVMTAGEQPAGPVHLNFPFREPLVPAPHENVWSDRRPMVRVVECPRALPADTARLLTDELGAIERGLIVCGAQEDPGLAGTVRRLAKSFGYPVLADPLSQVRCGCPSSSVIATYDAFLRDNAGRPAPDVVLRLGSAPTSKPLTQYLQRHAGARHIVVDSTGWNDPMGLATDLIHADPRLFCQTMAALGPERQFSAWLDTWQALDRATRAAIDLYLDELDEPFEGKVFAELARLLPSESTVFAGNSMPVRDLDTFFPAGQKPFRFMANRGANGIDGVISSALGASTAASPLVLVIGDISFYHDMNGLLASKLHGLDLTIILLNNDGGGIFSFLPQAGQLGFETLFGTPHGLDFKPAVEMYGGRFQRMTDWDIFRGAVSESLESGGLSVIEVPTERERNVVLHRALWARVSAAVAEVRGATV